jgi:hypothetical protein
LENLSRTTRFKEDEIRLIEEFLDKNPFFDFSTLTRTAVIEFIKNPSVRITPVSPKGSKSGRANGEASV